MPPTIIITPVMDTLCLLVELAGQTRDEMKEGMPSGRLVDAIESLSGDQAQTLLLAAVLVLKGAVAKGDA